MFGTPELILILIVVLFLFGPSKIPEMARSLGKAAGELKKAQNEVEQEFKKAQMETENNRIQSDSNKLLSALEEKDFKIRFQAIDMGLDVQNKTTEQLEEEISAKIKSKKSLPAKLV